MPREPERLSGSPHSSSIPGHSAESVVGYYLTTLANLDVAHLSARNDEPEADFVVTAGTRRLPVEVEYQQSVDVAEDTEGLLALMDEPANGSSTALLICQDASQVRPADDRIVAVSLADFLLVR